MLFNVLVDPISNLLKQRDEQFSQLLSCIVKFVPVNYAPDRMR